MTTSVNRIALVTGANKGLGFETSCQLAQQGVLVLLGCRSAVKGNAAAKELQKHGLPAQFIQLDITKPEQIRDAAAAIKKRFGKLDILVNNAATSVDEDRNPNSTATVSPEALRQTFDVNFFGLVELTQKLLFLIQKSDAGRIVNVSSIQASLTIHSKEGGLSSYKPFASGTNIKVNSAHPGWVRTEMGGPHAPLSPAEGAKTAVRLGSPPSALKVRAESSSTGTRNCRGKRATVRWTSAGWNYFFFIASATLPTSFGRGLSVMK